MKIIQVYSILVFGLLSRVVGNDGSMEEKKETRIVKQANEEIRRQLKETGATEQEVDRAVIRVETLAEMEEQMEVLIKGIETGGYLMEVLIVGLKTSLQIFDTRFLVHDNARVRFFLGIALAVMEDIKASLSCEETLAQTRNNQIMEYLKQWLGEEMLQLLPQQLLEENKIIQIIIEEISSITNLVEEITSGVSRSSTQPEILLEALENGRKTIKNIKGKMLGVLQDIWRERREKTRMAAKEQIKDLGSNLKNSIEKAEGKVHPLAKGIKKIKTWKILTQAIPKNPPQILSTILLDNQSIKIFLANKNFQKLLDEQKIKELLGEEEIKDLKEKEDITSILDLVVKKVLTTIEKNMQRKSSIAVNNLEKLLKGGLGKWGWILLAGLLCVLVIGATIFWLYKKQRIKKTV